MRKIVAPLVALGLALGGAACTGLLGDFSTSSTSSTSNGDGGGTTGGDGGKGSSSGEGGGGTGGGEGGADGEAGSSSGGKAISSCAFVASQMQQVTMGNPLPSTGRLQLYYEPGSSNALALYSAENSNVNTAYEFRPDVVGGHVATLPLVGPQNGNAQILDSTRSADDLSTYVLAQDGNNAILYVFNDSGPNSGVGGAMQVTSPTTGINIDRAKIAPLSPGLFIALNERNGSGGGSLPDGGATLAAFESSPTLPSMTAPPLMLFPYEALGDFATLAYPMSDGTVLLFYNPSSGGGVGEGQFQAGSTTPLQTQTLSLAPVFFQKDGLNVDVVFIELDQDAGTYTILSGVKTERMLPTLDPTTLSPVDTSVLGPAFINNACAASWPGYIAVMTPLATGGMQLGIVDIAASKVAYSLTGSSVIMGSNTAINTCAMDRGRVMFNTMVFDVAWIQNDGNNTENLYASQIQCTLQ
jgi:hypothetical protein